MEVKALNYRYVKIKPEYTRVVDNKRVIKWEYPLSSIINPEDANEVFHVEFEFYGREKRWGEINADDLSHQIIIQYENKDLRADYMTKYSWNVKYFEEYNDNKQ
jgi:hypothetical protein